MNRKYKLAMLIVLIILAAWPAAASFEVESAAAQKGLQVRVHGKAVNVSASAIVVDNTALVPLRSVAEALGAKVQTGSDKMGRTVVTLSRGDKQAQLTVGSAQMTVNGRTVKLGVAPRLSGNVVMVPLRAISESLGTVVTWDGVKRIVRIDEPAELPVIGTAGNLNKLLERMQRDQHLYSRESVTAVTSEAAAAPASGSAGAGESAAAQATSADGGSGGGFSQTNVQVDGVDEADWAKTDGRFIYQVSGSRIMIVNIADPSKPKLAATIKYTPEDQFQPLEMYVDDHRLVVIGQNNGGFRILMPTAGTAAQPASAGGPAPAPAVAADPALAAVAAEPIAGKPAYPAPALVKTLVYELSDAGEPKLVRETELEGSYISSRKIGGALYIVTNKDPFRYGGWEIPAADKASSANNGFANNGFEPLYRDSAKMKKTASLPLDRVHYFPDSPEYGMMMVGALDLDRPGQEMQVNAYLGSGQAIYASERNLYVAIGEYVQNGDNYRQETKIHKFRLDQGNVVYLGEGSVPGMILNQFSMDEYQGYFRIATTRNDGVSGAQNTMTNNMYVLDESLKTIGTLDNLAPGERIYSTRFLGKRAYMVTFRTIDPLFAIDLADPTRPKVLGELKIPGFSDYLHPYDENHLIGFGQDTVEIEQGRSTTNGLKIGLFDVTDPTNPKEMFKETIGDRGTHSELLQNHKALLFSKEKGLLAFPVDLMEIPKKSGNNGELAYGQLTYQGAYVYGIDLKHGFQLRGRITHLAAGGLNGNYGYDYGMAVRRILYAGDTLYTLSDKKLKGSNLSTLEERGSFVYPAQ